MGSIPIVSTKNHEVRAFRRDLVEPLSRGRAHYVPFSMGHSGRGSVVSGARG